MRLVLTLLLIASFAGCLADAPTEGARALPINPTPSYNNTQPASVTGMEFVAQLQFPAGSARAGEAFPSGSGIWVFGDLVVGSALGSGFFIADVSDPTAPVLLYNATTDAANPDNNTITSFARDADVVAHADGRLTLLLATQNDGMHVWDISIPTAPVFMSRVEVTPNHNIAAVPGTELVFNAQSGGLGRSNELIDVHNALGPVVLGAFGNHGCHDLTFFGEFGDEKFRAYCAGIQRTEIWDLTNLDPTATGFGIRVLGTVDGAQSPVVGNPAFGAYPVRTLHHLAMVNADASILIIGDEQNGGRSPGGCYTPAGAPASSPTGALWFYDLSNEAEPQLLSWIGAPLVQPDPQPEPNPEYDPANDVPNCTAHFGTLVPGEEKIVMAWYSAGVVLIDFSDPQIPVILEQYQPNPTNPWDARIQGGYVFTGDIVRGMDVLRLT